MVVITLIVRKLVIIFKVCTFFILTVSLLCLQQSLTTLVGNFTMSTTPILGTNYSSGNCQIKIALPPEGKYNYSAIIIPGEVLVFPSFNGSNEIRKLKVFVPHIWSFDIFLYLCNSLLCEKLTPGENI